MPKIPVMTAQGQGTLLRLPAANAEALGGQAGRATIGFGQTLQQIDQAIQAQRDEIDYAEKAAQFDLQVADETRKLLDDRTLDDQKKPQLLQDRMREIRRTVMGESSQHVAQALMIHEQRALPTTMIHFQAEMRQRSIAQTEVDFVETLNKRADVAALNPEMATQALTEVNELTERAKLHPVMSVPFITKAKADAMDRYWSQVAMNRPEEIFAIAAETVASGTRPAGMDLGQLGRYETIATHAMNARKQAMKAAQGQQSEAFKKDLLTNMWGGADGKPGRDVSQEILAGRDLLDSKEYEHFLEENKKVATARETMDTEEMKRLSSYGKAHLLDRALTAKHDERINLQTLRATVNEQVFQRKALHPDDAGEILRAIVSAEDARQSTESPILRAKTDALRSLEVMVPMQSDPSDAFTLRNIQDAMQRQFRAELDRTPNLSPGQIQAAADVIRAQGELRVLGAQKRTAAQVDEELLGMERHWHMIAPGLVGQKHDLDVAKRKELERQYPLLRGIFSLHDARRERWNQLIGAGADQAAHEAGKKKP